MPWVRARRRRSGTTEELVVKRGESTMLATSTPVKQTRGTARDSTHKLKGVGKVVGVDVLKGRDEHEPRVHPEARESIKAHHRAKSNFHATVNETIDPEKDINVRGDDVATLVRNQDGRRRLEVIREARVRALVGSIEDGVH
ncbi:hypothetical protein M408DRAFT_148627 [Serendipita vermifera MAFF 305830]|uniref:Uncharacterized protein n=1 Tax=Serendipita vermifera MAFF 305830 TaxID=933852 RepID=A0A0C2W0X2_SERVB|nr:hypothetical protein M408DRAFT_148627 [Serendipita vermifera MAFF 305830]